MRLYVWLESNSPGYNHFVFELRIQGIEKIVEFLDVSFGAYVAEIAGMKKHIPSR